MQKFDVIIRINIQDEYICPWIIERENPGIYLCLIKMSSLKLWVINAQVGESGLAIALQMQKSRNQSATSVQI